MERLKGGLEPRSSGELSDNPLGMIQCGASQRNIYCANE